VNKKSYNLFEIAQKQFDRIAAQLGLNKATSDLLRVPMREYHFSIPTRMDDGSVVIFRGSRVQHNDARGPAKGGIRFHVQDSIDNIRAIAMLMTWISAVADLPLGGSMGAVDCDPHMLSPLEQERLCRGWVRQASKNVGPEWDVPGPDLRTNSQHMLWMPVREALKDLEVEAEYTTASVQGFGNVGQHAIELYHRMGGRVICVACWDQEDHTTYAYRKKDGIDFEELQSITNPFGEIDKRKAEEKGYERLPGETWVEQEVDILVPAALENQIIAENVNRIHKRVRIIVEAANSPTTPDAQLILKNRKVLVIPDLLANAGGFICSYFEQVQGNMNYYWRRDEVLGKLDVHMTDAFLAVSNLAMENKLDLRDAAYMIAVSRVAQACQERGWV